MNLNIPKNLINCTEITQVLDRFKILDNAATMLVASFIKACQSDINNFCISRSTTYRAHIANRLRISDEIFQEICEAPSQDLALHWDGKLTKDYFRNKHEALSVLVSGTSTYKEGKLLRVQRLEKASEPAQTDASYVYLRCGI